MSAPTKPDLFANLPQFSDGDLCTFQPLDTIEITNLKSKLEYNGCRGRIIGHCTENNSFPVNILHHQQSKRLLVPLDNIKLIGIGDNVYSSSSDAMDNGVTEQQFNQMDDKQKAQVLLSRTPIYRQNISFLDFILSNTGSNGLKCDGCGLTRNLFKRSMGMTFNKKDSFLEQICPDCKYGVCEDCVIHCSYRGGVDRGCCFCRDSNFGNEYDSDKSKRLHYQYGRVSNEQRQRAKMLISHRLSSMKRCYECNAQNSELITLRKCANCQKRRYCSVKCQKRSWKRKEYILVESYTKRLDQNNILTATG
eukprot:859806_1